MNAEHSFDPADADPRDFRNALGRFATGVTIITCDTGEGPIGITANSFASLSLDPALVLWSPAKSSQRYRFFVEAEHFAVHVLDDDQRAVCDAFTRDGNAFAPLPWANCPRGVPLIDGCLSRFECDRVACHDGGDHSIVVGQVTRVTTRPGKPLLFFNGTFGEFGAL